MPVTPTDARHALYYRQTKKRKLPWILFDVYGTRDEAMEAAAKVPFKNLDLWVSEVKPADTTAVASDPAFGPSGACAKSVVHENRSGE